MINDNAKFLCKEKLKQTEELNENKNKKYSIFFAVNFMIFCAFHYYTYLIVGAYSGAGCSVSSRVTAGGIPL